MISHTQPFGETDYDAGRRDHARDGLCCPQPASLEVSSLA